MQNHLQNHSKGQICPVLTVEWPMLSGFVVEGWKSDFYDSSRVKIGLFPSQSVKPNLCLFFSFEPEICACWRFFFFVQNTKIISFCFLSSVIQGSGLHFQALWIRWRSHSRLFLEAPEDPCKLSWLPFVSTSVLRSSSASVNAMIAEAAQVQCCLEFDR